MTGTKKKRGRIFRWGVRALAVLVFLFVVASVVFYILARSATSRWERLAGELRAEGRPLTYAEIEASRPAMADGSNGAVAIRRAAQVLESVAEPDESGVLLLDSECESDFFKRIDRGCLPATRAYVEARRRALAEISELRSYADVRLNVSYAGTTFDTITAVIRISSRHRALARLVNLDAILKILDGDAPAAVDAQQVAQDNAVLAREREQEAKEAGQLARDRADELKIVTEFQQSMLGEIDAEKMGRDIVADQRERIREGLENDGASPEEVETALASFDGLVAKINATNLALKVVDKNVLARAVETIEKEFADQPVTRAALRQTVADTYRDIALYEAAMSLQEACLLTRRQELGNDHPDTLASINNMGALLQDMGEYEEAVPYYRESLREKRRVLGDDHPETLTTICNMGNLLRSRYEISDARVAGHSPGKPWFPPKTWTT